MDVNGWFGAFSNRGTPKNPNPFRKGISGSGVGLDDGLLVSTLLLLI